MKKIIPIVMVAISTLLCSCGGAKSADTVSKYLKAESSCDYETAYSLLSDSDKQIKPFASFKEEESSEFGLLFNEAVRKSTTFKILDSNENENSSIINVEITQDDYSSVVSEMLGAAFSGASSDDLTKKAEKYFANLKKDSFTLSFFHVR